MSGLQRRFSASLGRATTALMLIASMAFGVGQVQAQATSAIEMNASGATTATQTAGIHVNTLAVTMQNNTDNPSGTTFAAVSPGPTPIATYTLSNQQFTGVGAATTSTGNGVFIGTAGTSGNVYYSPLSGIGSPSNVDFTSDGGVAASTGINTTSNYGVRLTASAFAVSNAALGATARIQMADLTISFNTPVTNPILHFGGLGGRVSLGAAIKGFSAEFDVLTGGGVTSIARLSGNSTFAVSGTSITNSSTDESASCATTQGACGSVRVFGENLTQIVLRVYLQSSFATAWNFGGNTAAAGDSFHISVSAETADMTPAFSGLPTQIVPGVSYPATLTCTNLGPNRALSATCVPSASVGTVSGISCTPTLPATISGASPNNTSVCTFNYTLPVGGTQTSVVFTGQTTATNDRNGGIVGSAGNNQVQQTVNVRAPRLQSVKVLNGTPGRDQATDQFTLAIAGNGGPVSATTSGTGTTVTGGSPVIGTATAGQTYTLTETYAGTALAANYTTTYACVNALSGGSTIASGSGTSITTPALRAGDDITCTFTNTYTNRANLVTTKTLGAGGTSPVATGATVTFLISVRNAGPGTARNVQLTDLLPAGMTPAAGNGAVTAGTYAAATGLWTIPTIASGVTRTLTLVGTVNADQGGVTLTNTIPAAPTSDTIDPDPTGNDLTESVVVTAAPRMGVVKTSAYSDLNANGRQDAGDRITYTYTVTNTGNTRLEDVVLAEQAATFTGTGTLPAPIVTSGGANLDGQGDALDLAFGASMTFGATYTLTQDDIDAGEVSNQVLASAADPAGTPVTDLSHPSLSTAGSNAPTETPLTPPSSLGAVKTSAVNLGGDGILNANDTITYTYVVTNTGATTVFNVGVSETAAAFSGTGTLPTPTYLSGGANYDAGVGTATDLRPLETVTFTATYTLTQADIDAGSVTNQALAAGTNPQGGSVTDPSDESSSTAGSNDPTETPLVAVPKIELEKSSNFVDVNGNGRADAGDRIDYAFAVANTGAVTLTSISITDPLPGISISGTIASLAPGATDNTSITASYTLLQADVDAGQVENSATVSGNTPGGTPVTDVSDDPADPTDVDDGDGDPGDPTVTLLLADPELTLDKRTAAGAPAAVNAVGQVLNYEFEITNSGNITVAGPFAIQDNKITTPITCPAGPLAPGASLVCTGSYSVVQADLNEGEVANTAHAVEDVIGTLVPASDPDTFVVPAVQNPKLTIDKSAPVIPAVNFDAGLVVPYTYLVTNTGNVTITDPITVTDNRIASVSCPALPSGGLVPLDSITCTANYTVTAGDVGQTRVTNVATGTDGNVTSPPDTVTIPQGAAPGLTIEKSLAEVNGDVNATAFGESGDLVVYEYRVRNTGTAAYAADVVVNDDMFPDPIVCFDSAGGTVTFPPYNATTGAGEVICQSEEYEITQANVEANQVTNVATASSIYGAGTENPSVVTSESDSVTVPGTPRKSMTVVKTANPASGAEVDDTITYTIVTTNTGNQTLNPVTVSDPKLTGLTCDILAPISLAPGASVECEGTYVVTQNDVDEELIENTAFASGMPPQGTDPVTAFGEADHVPKDPENSMTLAKSGVFNDANTNGRANVGETITYIFTVRNTGDQTLNTIVVNDPNLTPSLVGTIATLAPGASQTLTATYPLTQADIDNGAGQVSNIASLDAKDPDGADLTQVSDNADTPIPRVPDLSLVKTGTWVDTNADGIDNIGDTITYTFAVTNTGNVTLTGLTLADTFPGLVITGTSIASLAPGATDNSTFSGSYTVAVDALNGDFAGLADPNTVHNEATVTGNYDDAGGPTTIDASDEVDVAFTPEPSVTIVKTADTSALSNPPEAGEQITYSFEIENTGNVTLSGVAVTDVLPGIVMSGAPVTLDPDDIDNTTYSATYTLTLDDLDDGEVVNTATVSGLPPNAVTPVTDTDGETVPLDSDPEIEVVKTANVSGLSDPVAVGDLITYSITVTNTGNKRLTDVVLNDPLLGVTDLQVGTGTMNPGDVVVLNSPVIPAYSVTQADIDRGYVDNQATASGENIVGGTPEPVSDLSDDPTNATGGNDPTRALLPADPELSLIKEGAFTDLNANSRADVGDRVTYTFTVKNEGNVTVENLTISDPLIGIVLAGGPIASLAPGASDSTTFTGYVVLTQAMITAGHVDNRATVTGEDPSGGPVTDASHPTDETGNADTVVALPQEPRLALVKTGVFTDAGSGTAANDGNSAANTGEIVTYTFRVTNTGNVPVTGITVTDTGIPGLTVSGGPITLNPGQVSPVGTFTASYPITQANVNAGLVSNTAVVTGTDPNSATVTDNSHPSSTANGAETPTDVVLPRRPALTLTKDAPGGAVPFQAGTVVTYNYVVTNAGNTAMPGPITINDNMIGAIACGSFPGGGLPGAVLNCSRNYTITPNDALLGSVLNNARATDGITQSPTADELVTFNPGDPPALGIEKELLSVNGNTGITQFSVAGDKLRYRFTVTNTGGAAFPSPVYVTDDVISPGIGDILCWDFATLGSFNVGQVTTCEAEYEITQEDLDRTTVTNEAFASSVFAPASASPLIVQSPVDAVTTQSVIDPKITIEKSSTPASGAAVGQTITYSLVVTNTGNQTLSGVTVTDNMLTDLSCNRAMPGQLLPQQVMTCTGTHVVTQQEVDNETIPNEASVTSTSPQGATKDDDDTYDHVPVTPNPQITLEKTASAYDDDDGDGRPDVGEEITYTFVVTNNGNQTLNTVVLDDPNLTPSLIATVATLSPGATQTYQRVYELTQADLDATTGAKSNTATLDAKDPDDVDLTQVTDTATTPLPRVPRLTVSKTGVFVEAAAPAGVQNAGDRIDYTITVTNSGNVTVTGIDVEDPLLGGLMTTIASLAPGQSQDVTDTYTLLVGDLNTGARANTATATGTGSNGTALVSVEADDDFSLPLTQAPALTLDKQAPTGTLAVGQTLTYTVVATNSGNITQSAVVVSDPQLTPSSNTCATLAPLATCTLTGTHVVTQVEVDAGEIVNTASVASTQVTTPVEDTETTDIPAAPALTLDKRAPTGTLAVGQTLTYTVVATNSGNITQSAVVVSDPQLTPSSFTCATLAPLATCTLTGTHVVTQAEVDAGEIVNTASVESTQVTTPVEDTETTDIPADPRIALVKTAVYTDIDSSNAASAGDTVTYTYTVTNLGNVTAIGVTVAETAAEFTGTGTLPAPNYVSGGSNAAANAVDLAPTTSATWTATYSLTAADITAGGVTNQAEAVGEDPSNAPLTDLSDESGTGVADNDPTEVTYNQPPVAEDDTSENNPIGQPVTINPLIANGAGVDRDPDGTLDPTSVRLMNGTTQVTRLEVAGQGVWEVNTATGAITFTPLATFTGDPDPVDYVIADDEGAYSAPATLTVTYTPAPEATPNTSSGNPIGQPVTVTLLTDDTVDTASGRTVDTTSVQLTLTGVPAGSTLSPNGKTLTVPGEGVWTVNENGTATFTPEDGFTDAPTPVSYTFADDQGNRSNEATITVTFTDPPVATDNTGEYVPGSPVTISVIANDSSPSGRPLDPASVQIVGTSGPGLPLVVPGQGTWSVDTATGSIIFTPETGYTGDPTPIRYTVADDQGNRSNEATVTVVSAGIPEVSLAISVDRTEDTNGDGVFGPGDTVFWKFRITNSGNVPLFSVSIINPSLSMPGLSCSLPASYSEPGSPGLLPGESVDLVCVNTGYVVTAGDMERGTLSLRATAVANDRVGQEAQATASAATFALTPGGVEITKSAALRNVRAGQLVPYTIEVTNRSTLIPVTVNVIDSLPEGLVYREGTGAVGGTTRDPAVSGSRLAFNNVSVRAGGTVTITLSAYVTQSARPGEKVNSVQAFSSLTGLPVSPKATATVMLNADPIFDCGTVIGRVFDDANQDGYMDGPVAYDRDLTDDDVYVADKYSVKPLTRKTKGGEKGIPGVRLVTVNGTIITTDEFGRFHVPCAELPRDIGSNFLLKLDERTLPTGYRMTTENPRVMRLTAGKMSEMNFGAAISRVVRIELSDAAFVQSNGKDRPRPELEAGLRQLLGQIASTPSNLRIIYQVGADGERAAKSRMRTVEAMVRKLWNGNGRYKLNVEKEIKK